MNMPPTYNSGEVDFLVDTEPSIDPNESWEELSNYMGGIDKLVGGVIKRTKYFLDLSDAVGLEDLKQDALYGLWLSWKDKIEKAPSYMNYITRLKGLHSDIDVESPSVFGGYAKRRMTWAVIKYCRPIVGTNGTSSRNGVLKTRNEASFTSITDDEYDIFESLELQSVQEDPGVDNATLQRFHELFGIDMSSLEPQILRIKLLESAREVLSEYTNEAASGSGGYRKLLPTAIANRRVAFNTLYLNPILGIEKSLRQVAKEQNLDYDALKKEAQRIPVQLFTLKDKILDKFHESIKESSE